MIPQGNFTVLIDCFQTSAWKKKNSIYLLYFWFSLPGYLAMLGFHLCSYFCISFLSSFLPFSVSVSVCLSVCLSLSLTHKHTHTQA